MTPRTLPSRRVSRLAGAALGATIRFYQVAVSPLIGPRCRFVPTCSEYARQSIAAHGPSRGLSLAVRRIFRCHPFHPGGIDPVPAASMDGAGRNAGGECC